MRRPSIPDKGAPTLNTLPALLKRMNPLPGNIGSELKLSIKEMILYSGFFEFPCENSWDGGI